MVAVNGLLKQLKSLEGGESASACATQIQTALARLRAASKSDQALTVESVSLAFVGLLIQRGEYELARNELVICRQRLLDPHLTRPLAQRARATDLLLLLPVEVVDAVSTQRTSAVLIYQHRLLALLQKQDNLNVDTLLKVLSKAGHPLAWLCRDDESKPASSDTTLQQSCKGIIRLIHKAADSKTAPWSCLALHAYTVAMNVMLPDCDHAHDVPAPLQSLFTALVAMASICAADAREPSSDALALTELAFARLTASATVQKEGRAEWQQICAHMTAARLSRSAALYTLVLEASGIDNSTAKLRQILREGVDACEKQQRDRAEANFKDIAQALSTWNDHSDIVTLTMLDRLARRASRFLPGAADVEALYDACATIAEGVSAKMHAKVSDAASVAEEKSQRAEGTGLDDAWSSCLEAFCLTMVLITKKQMSRDHRRCTVLLAILKQHLVTSPASLESGPATLVYNFALAIMSDQMALSIDALQSCLANVVGSSTSVANRRSLSAFAVQRTLASCYAKQLDHNMAAQSYLAAVCAYCNEAEQRNALLKSSRTQLDIALACKEHEELAHCLQRYFWVSLVDARKQWSELRFFHELKGSSISHALVGLLLEMTLQGLVDMAHRSPIAKALPLAAEALLRVYEPKQYALCRLRASVQFLGAAAYLSPEECKTICLQAQSALAAQVPVNERDEALAKHLPAFSAAIETYTMLLGIEQTTHERTRVLLGRYRDLFQRKKPGSPLQKQSLQTTSNSHSTMSTPPSKASPRTHSGPKRIEFVSDVSAKLLRLLADFWLAQGCVQEAHAALQLLASSDLDTFSDEANITLAKVYLDVRDSAGATIVLNASHSTSDAARDFIWALCAAKEGRVDDALTRYESGRQILLTLIDSKKPAHPFEQAERLVLVARAALAFAHIQEAMGNHITASHAALRSINIYERSLKVLARGVSLEPAEADAKDVFDAKAGHPAPLAVPLIGAAWRSVAAYVYLSELDERRGSPRTALTSLTQAHKLVLSLKTSRWPSYLDAQAACIRYRASLESEKETQAASHASDDAHYLARILNLHIEGCLAQSQGQYALAKQLWEDGLRLCRELQNTSRDGNGSAVSTVSPSLGAPPALIFGLLRDLLRTPVKAVSRLTSKDASPSPESQDTEIYVWARLFLKGDAGVYKYLMTALDAPMQLSAEVATFSDSCLCNAISSRTKLDNNVVQKRARTALVGKVQAAQRTIQDLMPAMLATAPLVDLKTTAKHLAQMSATVTAMQQAHELPQLIAQADLATGGLKAARNYLVAKLAAFSSERELPVLERTEHKASEWATTLQNHVPVGSRVVWIHLHEDDQRLRLVSLEGEGTPLSVSLPFERFLRREGDGNLLELAMARAEIVDIAEIANRTAREAKKIHQAGDKTARQLWWRERKAADARLQTLLQSIETLWLGGWKCLLAPSSDYSPKALSVFYAALDNVFATASSVHGAMLRVKLEDAHVAALVNAAHLLEPEDIEDWLHCIVDALQIAGVAIPADEIDFDQAVSTLQHALDELAHTPKSAADVSHLYLILDDKLACFPWESIPCLRHRSISRLPTAELLRQPPTLHIDGTRVAAVLDPQGDLTRTRASFEEFLHRESDAGWQVISGRPPLEMELQNMLQTSDLFLFIGHGGAEQYVRGRMLASLSRCPTTMLWGCSSGAIDELGEYGLSSTATEYLRVGAPAVVATLWNVTDGDINLCTTTTLKQFGVQSEGFDTLAVALAKGRETGTLRYLNSASVVMYGHPVSIK